MASVKQNSKTKKWELFFDYYVNGKRKQVRKRGFKSKREAQDRLVELESEVRNGTHVEPSQITVAGFMKEYNESRKNKVDATSFYNHNMYVKNHILPFFDDMRLQDLNLRICQKFVDTMSDDGYAFNTIDRVLTIMKMGLDRAIDYKIIKENYARKVEMPLRTKKEMKVWTLEEVNQFLQATKNRRYHPVYALALLTGMRQGEILGLRWQDIDFDKKLIYVRQILTHYGKDFKSGTKTIAGTRTISISDKLIAVLKAERKKVVEKKLKAEVWHEHDLVICAKNGRRVFPANLTKMFKKDIVRAEVPDIRFHDMRHTHATMLIQKNVHVKVISERLGHSKISITMDTYSHVLPSMQQEVASQIDEMIQ